MGMSASQARLLALEARQSNLEYQGQQINQARTVLSQQCTALYNSLLDMKVPTPPSTTDFQTVQYKGTQGASKFTIGTVTPKTDGTYNVEMKFSRNGNCVKGGSSGQVTTYNEPEYIKGKYITGGEFDTSVKTMRYLNGHDDGHGDGGEISSEEIKAGKTDGGVTLSNDTRVMHSVTFAPEDYDGKFYYRDSFGRFVETDSFEEAKNANLVGDQTSNVVFIATTVGDIKDLFENKLYDDISLDYLYEGNPATPEVETTGGFTKDAFLSQTFYDGDGIKLTTADLEDKGNGLFEFKDTVKKPIMQAAEGGSDVVKNPKYDPDAAAKGVSIDGYAPLDFSALKGDERSTALQAIANSFPADFKNDDGTPNAAEIEKAFKVIYKKNEAGDDVPYFIRTTEFQQQTDISNYNGQGRVEIFSLEPNGTYTESKPANGAKLQFDANGRITSIEIPVTDEAGNPTGKFDKVSLEMETVVDEVAYNDAMSQYEYENYLYDQKNKEINAKTEIIQQEDRNLELKLQRLDNERTQITTEIEAVQKVIKENIEKSYKTFNG